MKLKYHLVNSDKASRAQEIIQILRSQPESDAQQEIHRKFSARLANAGIKSDSDKALRFVYQILGGLVRTEEEEEIVA